MNRKLTLEETLRRAARSLTILMALVAAVAAVAVDGNRPRANA